MIEIRDLNKSFGEQHVLRGISMTIGDGETVAIIGKSGCGKSVLLKNIIGLLRPDSGSIVVDGIPIESAREKEIYMVRSRVGFLFQSAALFDSMTIEENVTLGLREHGLSDLGELRSRSERALTKVGLSGTGSKMPNELSGGMRKRVGIARAIIAEPRYIFYDEPTTGLDPVTADQIDDLIAKLTNTLAVTSVIVTHDLFTVDQIAKRVIFLSEGQIYFDGTPAELRANSDGHVRRFLERYRGKSV